MAVCTLSSSKRISAAGRTDADGMGMGGRPEIDDAPVNGKSARRIDFGGFDVSGPQESRLEIGDIEAIVAS